MDLSKVTCYCFTLADYADYVVEIENRVQVKSGQWQTVRQPYMGVEGRIQLFRDLHDLANPKVLEYWKKFYPQFDELRKELTPPLATITTEIERTPILDGRFLLVKAVVESKLLPIGFGVGYATADLMSPRGADKTNPIENAETSAIGRALSNMGIGNIPGAKASAEEVLDAKQRVPVQKQPSKQSRALARCIKALSRYKDDFDAAYDAVKQVCEELMLPVPQRAKSGFPDIRKGYTEEQLELIAEALERQNGETV